MKLIIERDADGNLVAYFEASRGGERELLTPERVKELVTALQKKAPKD